MRDKSVGIAIAFGLIVFVLVWAQTNGFASQPVASTDVTVRQSAPTVNDDIDRGFLPGYQWIDQAGQRIYGLVSSGDGSADWDQLNGGVGGGGGHTIQDEGVDLTARSNLNFIGTGITCVDDAGSDASDCTIGSALHEFGNLFQDDTAPDAQVLANAGVFEVLTEFTGEGESSAGITLDGGNNNITLVNAGTYIIGFSISFSGTANKEYHVALFLDGVELMPSEIHRQLEASGAVGVAMSSTILVAASGGEVIDLRASPESNGNSITIHHGSIVVDEIQDFGSDDLPALADDSVWVGSAASVATASAVPDCDGAKVNRIQYDTTTNAWTCETDPIDISSGTNLTASDGAVLTGDDISTTLGTSVDVTSEITGIVPIANGGTGQVTATEDGLLMGNTSAFIVTVMPDCQDSGGNHANFNNTTDVWSCGTSVRAIDISDDTNLVAGSGITLTDDTLSVDVVDISSGTNLTASDGAILTGDDISTTLGTSVDVTSEITGIVPVANGGTGTSTITSNEVMIGAGGAAITTVVTGTAGFVLTSNGAAAPTWQAGGGAGLPVSGHMDNAVATYGSALPGRPIFSAGTEAFVGDRMYEVYFYVAEQITIDQVYLDVTTADGTSTNARVCIWEAGTDWQGDTLVVEETFSAATTGLKTMTISSPVTLTTGGYLVAWGIDKTVSLRTYFSPSVNITGAPVSNTLGSSSFILGERFHDAAAEISNGCAAPANEATSSGLTATNAEVPVFLRIEP